MQCYIKGASSCTSQYSFLYISGMQLVLYPNAQKLSYFEELMIGT